MLYLNLFICYFIIINFFCVCISQELDSKEAEEERKRSSQANKKTTTTKAAKKPPRKNTKKAKNVEPENDNSSMEIGKPELLVLLCVNLSNFDIHEYEFSPLA